MTMTGNLCLLTRQFDNVVVSIGPNVFSFGVFAFPVQS